MDSPFDVHQLNPEGFHKIDIVRGVFQQALADLMIQCPRSINTREFSLAKTKLEEGCFWALKAVSLDITNQRAKE